jgi:ribonuclease HI
MRFDTRIYDAWFDGSTSPHERRSGIGGIITSPDHKVVAKYSMEIPYVDDCRVVEYLSLIKLVEVLHKHNIKNVEIKTDCLGLCDSIKYGRSNRFNKLKPGDRVTKLHQEAIEVLNSLNYYMIKWVPRKRNKYADRLSKNYKLLVNNF